MPSLKKTFYYSKLLILPFFVTSITVNIPTVFAHKVKTDTDVGATLHIEPNDNPEAGKPTKLWFALARKGGKVIPLEECDCNLQVYKEPVKQQNSPILKPSLEAVSAEKYQGIPGTRMTFPTPGAYQLTLSGKPRNNTESFQAFELKFPVTVAVGKTVTETLAQAPELRIEDNEARQKNVPRFPLWMIVASGAIALGVIFIGLSRLKSNKGR